MSSELVSKERRERTAWVLIPLLVLQLILLSLQIEDPSGTLIFKTWTLTAQAPFIAIASSVTDGITSVWRNYIWLTGARAENEQLKQTVNKLLLANRAYQQTMQENARLRGLVVLNESVSFQTIGARVVARTPEYLSNVIYIDRGSADGVRMDAPVLSGYGIIGRTILVARHQSQVQLITNPDAAMGVILERTRTPGILRGTGNILLNLDYISNTEQIANGDMVVTSGLDGIFPKGFAVGKVVDSRKGKTVFRTIKVQPIMDLIRIEEVSVLLAEPKPEQGIAEQQ